MSYNVKNFITFFIKCAEIKSLMSLHFNLLWFDSFFSEVFRVLSVRVLEWHFYYKYLLFSLGTFQIQLWEGLRICIGIQWTMKCRTFWRNYGYCFRTKKAEKIHSKNPIAKGKRQQWDGLGCNLWIQTRDEQWSESIQGWKQAYCSFSPAFLSLILTVALENTFLSAKNCLCQWAASSIHNN